MIYNPCGGCDQFCGDLERDCGVVCIPICECPPERPFTLNGECVAECPEGNTLLMCEPCHFVSVKTKEYYQSNMLVLVKFV